MLEDLVGPVPAGGFRGGTQRVGGAVADRPGPGQVEQPQSSCWLPDDQVRPAGVHVDGVAGLEHLSECGGDGRCGVAHCVRGVLLQGRRVRIPPQIRQGTEVTKLIPRQRVSSSGARDAGQAWVCSQYVGRRPSQCRRWAARDFARYHRSRPSSRETTRSGRPPPANHWIGLVSLSHSSGVVMTAATVFGEPLGDSPADLGQAGQLLAVVELPAQRKAPSKSRNARSGDAIGVSLSTRRNGIVDTEDRGAGM